jgi:hypothetical protein
MNPPSAGRSGVKARSGKVDAENAAKVNKGTAAGKKRAMATKVPVFRLLPRLLS